MEDGRKKKLFLLGEKCVMSCSFQPKFYIYTHTHTHTHTTQEQPKMATTQPFGGLSGVIGRVAGVAGVVGGAREEEERPIIRVGKYG